MAAEASSAVLVIGGGIAGIKAALEVAEAGFKVYLVERSPWLGGALQQLDHQFPTNDCGWCKILPVFPCEGEGSENCLRTGFWHRNVEVLTRAEVVGLDGEAGNFVVRVEQRSLWVKPERCTACGRCVDVCPVEVRDEHNEGVSTRKAIYIKYPQAHPHSFAIDRETCTRCGKCIEVCEPEAIDLDLPDETLELSVGSVILAAGFDEFDAGRLGQFGYGRMKNVVTSIEFERMFSPYTPHAGAVRRPSDGKTPERVAFIQCVGSRDDERRHCSAVCCMHAIKEAMVAKGKIDGLECDIFHMDVRAFGKGYEAVYEAAKERYGVGFYRYRPSMDPVAETGDVRLGFEVDGERVDRDYDLVVLSVGLDPSRTSRKLAEVLGIELTDYGYCDTRPFDLASTSREGVFVCGALSEPKDIPETVAQAGEAAARAVATLDPAGKVTPVEAAAADQSAMPLRDISEEVPKIGVFLCRCGTEVAGVLNFDVLKDFAARLPGVQRVEETQFLCIDPVEDVAGKISDAGLNRVIFGACTPRLFERRFTEALRRAGLPGNVLEIVNLREQCAWPHRDFPVEATEKAKDLIAMAAEKLGRLRLEQDAPVEVIPQALVVGGGMTGLVAALALAKQGFPVDLVEKADELGGHFRTARFSLEGVDPRDLLKETIEAVQASDLITVHLGAEVVSGGGRIGNYETQIRLNGQGAGGGEPVEGEGAVDEPPEAKSEAEGAVGAAEGSESEGKEGAGGAPTKTFRHGVTILATGADIYPTTSYLMGEHPSVIFQADMEDMIDGADERLASAKNVVFIQCVDARDEGHPYCNRICCLKAVRSALALREKYPAMNIFVLYRDMRTYGFREEFYREAREKGVIFVQYDADRKPRVSAAGDAVKVVFEDRILDDVLEIDADWLVLSPTLEGSVGEKLAGIFGIPVGTGGFLEESNVKFRPVDFSNGGVFLCGLAHSPRFVEESMSQARSAALRAGNILSRGRLDSRDMVARVNEKWCSACGLCVTVCPFEARSMDEERKVAVVAAALCQGCGSCATVCPNNATEQLGYGLGQVMASIDAAV
jgi:heterodisulfide reductase subunit A